MDNQSIDLQGTRVLFVDNNTQDKEMIAKVLEDTPIVYDCVSGSDEALQQVSQEKYDVIFIDSVMPGEDGVTVLSRLQHSHLCDEVPALVMTKGYARWAKQYYLNAGFSGYLEKPFTKEKLQDAMFNCFHMDMEWEEKKVEAESILVIDDDQFNLLLAKRILSQKFEVSTVTSGAAAFAFLEEKKVDLILLDIRMPEMDGFTFLKIIKENPELKDIPIICLTADSEQESELLGFELGAVDFITKPFIGEIMVQRVTCILELGRLQKELQREVEKKSITLSKRNRQLNRLTMQVMMTLVGTIDAKDKYTNGHSIRVAEYSKMIAAKMNMSVNEQENIYYIGLLHDIGKIGIPDEIINKTSKLSDQEYDTIKTHPVIGFEILEKMSELPEIAIGARWHHERYDGTGYPDRLAGENIPLLARIIGVADAYDAMSSKRSYRDVLPQDYIREEIKRCMGTQFDPKVAEVMLQIIDEDTEYKLREW